jgi:alpha-beta hydrolase superfamily lysophospholipase
MPCPLPPHLLLALAVGVVGCAGCDHAARSLVRAPNAGRAIEPIEGELRVDVGPPAASLAIEIVEPTTAAPAPRGTVLVLHGIQDRKETYRPFADAFAAAGYRAVLVDLRGHGRSSGEHLTFGATDSRDLVQVVDALAAQGRLAEPLASYGHSYGAAAALQHAARDPRVRAVVTTNTFASMRDVVPPIALAYASWWQRPFVRFGIQPTITRAGRIAGFDPDDASPLRAIVRTDAAILLIHARGDTFISSKNAERMKAAAAPERTRLLLLDGEEHNSILTGPAAERIAAEAVEWFGERLPSTRAATRAVAPD